MGIIYQCNNRLGGIILLCMILVVIGVAPAMAAAISSQPYKDTLGGISGGQGIIATPPPQLVTTFINKNEIGTLAVGKLYPVTIKVFNAGQGDAGPSYARLKLLSRSVPADQAAKTAVWISPYISRSAIPSETTISLNISVQIPDISAGPYALLAYVSCTNQDCDAAYASTVNGKPNRPDPPGMMNVTVSSPVKAVHKGDLNTLPQLNTGFIKQG